MAPQPHEQVGATGCALATFARDGTPLEAWFPRPQLTSEPRGSGTTRLTPDEVGAELGSAAIAALRVDKRRGITIAAVCTVIGCLAEPPVNAYDAYLRLHLLSHRLIRPHGANMTGIFDLLTNVAWTSIGPCLPADLDEVRWRLRAECQMLQVTSIDKFPRMTDYVVPSGVRVADANRVRLGAHLASGTTVMHEGFCNFNAGTLGASMVEGRISAGVTVGDGTDIGGGASIMGTLSGGGKELISVGERCLLGANSGIGISLGDNCIVEAGCYVTAGTRVKLPDCKIVKALALSGESNLLFRRNSQTGAIEAISRSGAWGGLNPALHKVV
jgi:2,3,4,5-tetrahydropyridine-2,6-dicarboxylate N-succinyltransferase